MPDIKQLVRTLAEHAMAMKGARQNPSWCNFDVLEEPHVELAGGFWTGFLEANTSPGAPPVAMFPVYADRLKELQKHYPTIRESEWMERDGHIQMTVPLEAGIPVAFLKSLIDEGYALVWKKLNPDARLQIELAGMAYDEAKLIDRLIEIHNLQNHQKAIKKLARHAILLHTKKSSEAKIPLGATKIGGQPDLPAKTEWPAYQNGKPLAFLAQINLAGIAKVGSPIKGLPASGLLSLFSVWGWMAEAGGDPQTPDDGTESKQDENGWTVVLHTPPRVKLQRRKTPHGVNSYKPAAVDPTPILSLPNHRQEPSLSAQPWTDDEFDRFDRMQSDYRTIQTGHWQKDRSSFASNHLLGGYALFEQYFPEEVLQKGLAMLLQIGSDDKNSDMMWGDGGELTFYADAKALAKGRFERLWGTCQCG
jgi:uncharacterized protein YwqG